MTYDRDFLEQIESAVDLVEYATSQGFEFVRRSGRTWAHCTLHEDKTPSLMIDDKNQFHCFSCGAHGGIINWLRDYEDMSFVSAVEKAARLAGTDISKMCSSETLLFNKRLMKRKTKEPVTHTVLDNTLYEKYQKTHPQEWLDEGITASAMDYFDIRYDPGASRIVYPVRLLNGDLIGVKGRSVFTAEQCKSLGVAKYMNYYEIGTADFLQSLDKTLPYVKDRGEVILFEGIKSVMKAYGWGYENGAAVESHAINQHQVRLLISLGVDVTVAFDSDVNLWDKSSAGLRSALDTLSHFTNVYVVYDKERLLGGAQTKNSPVDCGREVWDELYASKTRWQRSEETR